MQLLKCILVYEMKKNMLTIMKHYEGIAKQELPYNIYNPYST